MTRPGQVPDRTCMEIALETFTSKESVRKVLRGQKVRGSSGQRVYGALRKRGLLGFIAPDVVGEARDALLAELGDGCV